MVAAGVILVGVVVAAVLFVVVSVVHRVLLLRQQPTAVRIDVAVIGLFCSITNESCVNTLLIKYATNCEKF